MRYSLLNRLTLACAATGLAISSVITFAHSSNMPLPCGGSSGCDQVAQDPSSYFRGVPVSAIGMAAYVFLLVVALARIRGIAVKQGLFVGFIMSFAGAIISVVLTYHAITKIHATCLWCLGSLTMMILSTLAYVAMPSVSKGTKDAAQAKSAILWAVIPSLIVVGIGVYGAVNRPKPPDLSSIDLGKVSYSELLASSRIVGQENAPVTIAEFSDLMCPACRQMHQRLLIFLVHQKGKVRLMFHHFPLVGFEGHEQSRYAAELSEQLNADDFWGFVGKVYAMDTKPTRDDLDKIFSSFHAKHLRTENAAKDEVTREMKIGASLGVKQTPTYILFIDGKPVAKASSYDIKEVISRPEFAKIFNAPAPKAK